LFIDADDSRPLNARFLVPVFTNLQPLLSLGITLPYWQHDPVISRAS